MKAFLPLLRHRATDLFAVDRGVAILAQQYVAEVNAMAARLPERSCVLNFCANRYCFAVTLGATLRRRQTNLLPPTQAPNFIAALRDQYPDLYYISESPVADLPIPHVAYTTEVTTDSAAFEPPALPADLVAAVAFTSGSTGRPVPNRKTWRSLVASAEMEGERLETPLGSRVGIVGTVPPQHMYGLESTVLIALQNGLVIHATRPFYPEDIRAALAQLPAPRMLVTTPVHLRALIEDAVELPGLQSIVCATAPLSDDLARAAERRFHAPVLEIYGFTEAGQVATRRTLEGPVWRTFRGLELRADGEDVVVHGGHVEVGAMLQDIVELKSAHEFTLHGRRADLVNVAGKRTSLAHLNLQLGSIAGVRDAVFFVPDDNAGAVVRLVAFAVAPGESEDSILTALRQRIDPAFMPRPLYLVDTLPRNATGKLPRAELERLWKALSKR